MSDIEKITITCQDGYTLAANFYPSKINNDQNPILICPATGILKEFYNTFALWLSEQDYDVLCFDFRGIGQSLHGPLKDSTASIQDWGQLDIPAAIDMLLNITKKNQVVLLGHSAGGQLLGVVPNYKKVQKVIAVSGSTGHQKGLTGRTKFLAPLMFKVIFPIARLTKGYGPTKAIGMGENLPKDVAKQWAQFCSRPGYIMNAVGKTIFEEYHQQITCPITAIWAMDDEIATETNVKDLLRLYPNAKTSMIELNPKQLGYKSIGHMAMFKKSHHNLWPILEKHIAA